MYNLDKEILSEKTLDNILKDTITAIESSKTQIFDIYEGARSEVDHIQNDIRIIKKKVSKIIGEVDVLEKKERNARQLLVTVSSNFKVYSEADIKSCYDNTKNLQVELAVMREQEQNLRQQRDDLELRLKQLKGTVDKARQLVAQVGVALGYLSAQMGMMVTQMEAVSQDKLFGAQIIKVQEDERLRVSREIHDGPAQIMANVIYHSSMCERLIDIDADRAKEGLQELREQIRGCLREIRTIIFDLRPMTLDDLGVVAAVQQFLEKFEIRFGVNVDFEIVGTEYKVNKHVEVSIFRIIQESLNNIHKHANVRTAKLVVEYNTDYISVFIEDNGNGFVFNNLHKEVSKEDCYGLMGMQERVKLLKGQFLLDSEPLRGTKIRILIPVKESKE